MLRRFPEAFISFVRELIRNILRLGSAKKVQTTTVRRKVALNPKMDLHFANCLPSLKRNVVAVNKIRMIFKATKDSEPPK